MAFSVNTNPGAMFALQNLNKTNSSLSTVQDRINTGLKVASAKDNAAIFAIAQGQRSEVAALNSVKSSLDRATSAIDVGIAAAEAVSDLLIQMKEKAAAAADPGASSDSRTKLNDEFTELVTQINTIVDNAEFNGVNVVNNGQDIQTLISIPDGTKTAGEFALTITKADLTAGGLSLSNSTISSAGTASTALAAIATAETTVNGFLSKLGAGAKRIDIQRDFTSKLSDAIETGIGNLVDADLALESAKLQSLQVKQQLGLQALSIANQAPGSVPSLFR